MLGVGAIAFSGWWANRLAGRVMRQPGYAVLAGFAGLILIPMICVLWAFTVPLALVLFALYCVALVWSWAIVSSPVGGWILTWMNRAFASTYARLAARALVISFFGSLP